MKCSQCRKIDATLDTYWDRFRLFLFHFFHSDIADLSQDKFTQGFSDGYVVGRRHYKEQEDERKRLEMELFAEPIQKQLLPLVDLNKVLTADKAGHLFLNGVKVDPKLLEKLKTEAHLFRNSALWEIITNTVDSRAYRQGWHQAKTLDDLIAGRSIGATVEIQKGIIEKVEKAK